MVNKGMVGMYDISKRPDFKEITAKGGRVRSDRKKLASLENGSKFAKCKCCKLDCDFKDANLKKDPESKCLVPKLRTAAIRDDTRVVSMDDDRLRMYMDELMGMYQEYCIEVPLNETEPKKIERERMRRLNTLFKRLKEYKEIWSPPIQKNLNVNVTTGFDRMKEMVQKHSEHLIINVDGGENNGK